MSEYKVDDINFTLRMLQRRTSGMWQYLKCKYMPQDTKTMDPAIRFCHRSIESSLQKFSENCSSFKMPDQLVRSASASERLMKTPQEKLPKSSHLRILENVCKQESRKHDYLQNCFGLGRDESKQFLNTRRFNNSKMTDTHKRETDIIYHNEGESEILNPFDVMTSFKRGPPSYWVGCSYGMQQANNRLDMTIRQTGELSNSKLCKLSAQLVLKVTVISKTLKTKIKRSVILKPAGYSMEYRSSRVAFLLPSEQPLSDLRIRFSLCLFTWCTYKTVQQWEVDCDKNIRNRTKTEWTRIASQKSK